MTEIDFEDEEVLRYGALFRSYMAALEGEDLEAKYSVEYLHGAACVLVAQDIIDEAYQKVVEDNDQ